MVQVRLGPSIAWRRSKKYSNASRERKAGRASPSQGWHSGRAHVSAVLVARHHLLGPFQRKPSAVDWRAPSTADVATSDTAVCLRAEASLKLHEAPDLRAIDSDVGLDVRGGSLDGAQVDAQQLSAPLQRRGDRPRVGRVVRFPSPHGRKVRRTSVRTLAMPIRRRPGQHLHLRTLRPRGIPSPGS
jgi:hypothetical protein